MTIKLDVVGIAVIDMAASLRFYRVLGLPIPEGAEAEPHVDLAMDGMRLAWDTIELLRGVYDEWLENPTGHRIELAFHCHGRDDVDATYQRMTAEGYRGHKAPWDAFWGQRYAIVEDPDGNRISLYA
jgi:catechol 2,3-dioxygenase-like lactoylglutathione lyase family enzyme